MSANVFDNFTDYQVKILFQGWYTLTVWQFTLSCVGLFAFTVVYHLLRLLRVRIEKVIRGVNERLSDRYIAEETENLVKRNGVMTDSTTRERNRGRELIGLYVAMFVLSTVQTALWLLLSMANMTFNPWVFLSIVLGYSLGDVAVHGKIASLRSSGSSGE